MRRVKKAMKRIALALSVMMAATSVPGYVHAEPAGESVAITADDFLEASGKNLVNQNGDVVNLRGTNAGGYLLQEFWMTPTAYTTNVTDEQDIFNVLTERFGEEAMYEIVDVYQDAYWTEADFDNCAELGMNVIRLPFWWRNLVDEDGVFYGYDETAEDPYAAAFERMDWFVAEAGERGMYVIIDFHGAPGSQNGSDHSGVDGGEAKEEASEFFFGEKAEAYQQIYYDMWDVIAERYNGNPIVAGYDLLNEPYCTYRYNSKLNADELHELLWNIYDEAYDIIRAKDADHVVIMEATWDPVDLPSPAQYGWENIMYEYHNYLYDDYDNANGQQIANMQNKLNAIGNADYNVPSYMGEFSYFNSPDAWNEGLELLVNSGINWTTWTYKTTQDYGMWGQFHHPEEFNDKINLETASKEEILAWYARMGETVENTTLTDVTKVWYAAETVANTMGPKYASVEDGSYYLVGNNTMQVLTADESTNLVAATDEPGDMGDAANQLFTLVNNNDGTVSLKASNNNYISVSTTDNKMYATATEITDTEKFYMLEVSATTVAFKSLETDTYVTVVNPKLDEGEEAPATYDVLVQSYSITGDESFQLYDTDIALVGAPKLATYSGWTRLEAEDDTVATIYGNGSVNHDVAAYSGGAAAGNLNNDTLLADVAEDWSNINYVEFTVNAEAAGEYLLSLNYNGNDDKTILVKVNDGEQAEVSVPSRVGGSWDTLYEQIIKVNLAEGENTIAISGTINGEGWMNIDCVDMINAPLGTNDVYTRYEAENYYTNAAVKEQGHFSNGKGVENCNSDVAVEDVAFNWANIKYVDFTIYAEEAGEYTVVLGYTGAGATGMTALYRLNGGDDQVMTLDNAGGNWNIPSTYSFNVDLKEGFNKLMISGTIVTTAHYANIDYIDVKLSSVADTPKEPEGASGWSHFEAEKATIKGASKSAQDFYSMGMGVGSLNTPDITVDDVEADWSNINYVAFDVEAPRAGDYRVLMRYNGDDNKVALVRVNDGEAQEISIPRKGDGTWNVMHEQIFTVTLAEGENTLYISGAIGTGWFDMDYIEVSNTEIMIQDAEAGTERYEAEFFKVKSSNNPPVEVKNGADLTYSGPNNEGVGGMGSKVAEEEFTIGDDIVGSPLNYTIFTVYAEEEGKYNVKLTANGGGFDTQGAYQVNDSASQHYDVLNADNAWNTLFYPEFEVTLNAGLNTIVIAGPYTNWDHWMNFDCIDVAPVTEEPTPGPNPDPEPVVNPFGDVKDTDWFKPYVMFAYKYNLMGGKGTMEDGSLKFDPANTITRAEFVQMLYSKEGKPAVEYVDTFTDVADEKWYTDAILWAAEEEIVGGKKADYFDVNGKITRQEIALILYKYALYNEYNTEELVNADFSGFADASKVATWAETGMKWAVKYNVIGGKTVNGETLLSPGGNATRAEAATMMKAFMGAYEGITE